MSGRCFWCESTNTSTWLQVVVLNAGTLVRQKWESEVRVLMAYAREALSAIKQRRPAGPVTGFLLEETRFRDCTRLMWVYWLKAYRALRRDTFVLRLAMSVQPAEVRMFALPGACTRNHSTPALTPMSQVKLAYWSNRH